MHILEYRIRKQWWKCQKKNHSQICTKVFVLTWWFLRVNAQIWGWKQIYGIRCDIVNVKLASQGLFTVTGSVTSWKGHLHLTRLNVIPVSMFTTCQTVCCQGDCLVCFRLVAFISPAFYYGDLLVRCLYRNHLIEAQIGRISFFSLFDFVNFHKIRFTQATVCED